MCELNFFSQVDYLLDIEDFWQMLAIKHVKLNYFAACEIV